MCQEVLYGKVFLSECLNMLVIYVVSLPIYVNVAHLCLSVGEFCFRFCLGLEGFCGWIGKELLYRILWIMFSSWWYSSLCNWYEFSMLYKNPIAAYFCCVGWLDV